MNIPFNIHIELSIDYDMPNEERHVIRETIVELVKQLNYKVMSDGAGPYQKK